MNEAPPRIAARPTRSSGHAPAIAPHVEELARRNLRRNRALATGLLLAMVAVFAATHFVRDPGFAVLLLRAGAEAGIVGGLADWFAVTALFRHPLGLPIPHTAILAANKERIGRTLGNFIEKNFLTPAVVLPKLRSARAGERFAAWLAEPATAAMTADWVIAALPHVVRSLENRELQDFASRTLGEQLHATDIGPAVSRAVHVLTASGEADVLFERAVEIAARWLEEHRGDLDEIVRRRSRWWIPRAVDRRIAAAIVDGALELLNGLREPESDVRLKFREALTGLTEDLIHSPERRAELNAAKNRLLDHPDVQAWLASVWHELSGLVLADLVDPASKTRAAVEKAIRSVGQALAADPAMQRQINRFLERLANQAIWWRGEIGAFIAEVVRGWDTRTLSDRLELIIGSDLQYIRMNGSVVGACVGCAIFLISRMLD
jgi:uncharacterized membrane-anchored protein YjiN (DUF445 family)